ncbi:MAG: cytochrome c [Planctomycetes bacterium]|nr:cytochrome c [Planctomycetota bacterium]
MTRVSFCITVAIGVFATLACEERRDTRFKRNMREIDRAFVALDEHLKPDRIGDVAGTQRTLKGVAASIASVLGRPEVVTFKDEEDFRKYAEMLREDATALEQTIAEGKLEEAMNVGLTRVNSGCALCHNQYKNAED